MGRHRGRPRSGAAREEALRSLPGSATARRVGPLAAGALACRRRGRVVSVHRRAVSILFEGGPLVAVLPEGAPLHPWAITTTIALSELAVGDKVAVNAGLLAIGAATIALAGAETPTLRLRSRPSTLAESAAGTFRSVPVPEPSGSPFDSAVGCALARFRAGGAPSDLTALVGLGSGLTPSGDDALVGVLSALDSLREASPAAESDHIALAAALTPEHLARTTALSGQMLDAAVEGLYAEPIQGFLEAYATASASSEVRGRAAADLLAMGHRSGMDTLLGIAASFGRLRH